MIRIALLGFILSLTQIMSAQNTMTEPKTVEDVDLPHYLGKW